MILPRAQKSHVTTHAIALLQHYALDHPYMSTWSASEQRFVKLVVEGEDIEPLSAPFDKPYTAPRALGLRRLQWQAHHLNVPSNRLAQRMKFIEEGKVRAQRIAQTGGEKGRPGDGGATGSRTSWVGAVTWVDWEDEAIQRYMDAQVARR